MASDTEVNTTPPSLTGALESALDLLAERDVFTVRDFLSVLADHGYVVVPIREGN